jgi:uncharacterized membrane protein YkvA (DUF1232 family)
MVVRAAIGLLISLVAIWLMLVAVLVVRRPRSLTRSEAVALVPDLLRLLGALARDREIPRRVRLSVWLLLAFMASPIDVIPDAIPVIGVLDDLVLAYLVLRYVVRRSGRDVVGRHWTGTPEGLAAIERTLG